MGQCRKRRGAAGAHVGSRARNRGSRRNAAEEGGEHVAYALSDEFVVGVMAPSRHAIGHHGAQQRFDGAKHRDRQSGRQQLPYQLEAQADWLPCRIGQRREPRELGQDRWYAVATDPIQHVVKPCADRRDHGCLAGGIEPPGKQRADQHCNQVSGYAQTQARPQQQHHQRHGPNQRFLGLQGRKGLYDLRDLVDEVAIQSSRSPGRAGL